MWWHQQQLLKRHENIVTGPILSTWFFSFRPFPYMYVKVWRIGTLCVEEKRSSSKLESLELEQVWMIKKSEEDTCLWLAGEANRLWCQNPPSDASTFKPEDCSQFSPQFPFITTSSFHFYQLFFVLTWISLLCCKTLHSYLFPWPLLLNKHIVSF